MAGLQAYDPSTAQVWEESTSRFEITNVWTYFTKPDSIVIAPNLLVRKDFDSYWSTNFIHLGRNRDGVKCTTVKFSENESYAVLSMINKVLGQKCLQLEQGKRARDVVLTINGTIVNKTSSDVTKLSFWTNPSESMASIKLKVSFNQLVGDYQLSILVPVSLENSQKNHNWPGPVITLNANELDVMATYLESLTE